MTCRIISTPTGTIIARTRGQRPRKCYQCGRPAKVLCDFPVGIPGSGGPDWLRNDYELIVCTTRPGRLPWSDNTACGHPPKWAPGGEMSHRLSNGTRRNAWGDSDSTSQTNVNGERKKTLVGAKGKRRPRRVTRGHSDGDTINSDGYDPPAIANPGNVIHVKVGGNLMGSPLAHKNEAPFPQSLCEFFVRSFCPPYGIVCDPFTGSGTTGAAAVKWQRRFIGCDVRQSQVQLATRRIGDETPLMFTEKEGVGE